MSGKIFDKRGFLNADGEKATAKLKQEIGKLLTDASIEDIQTIGCLLHKVVGDMVCDAAQEKRNLAGKFAAMSDEEFEKYLDDKYSSIYGNRWIVKASLTEEEGTRHLESFKRRMAQVEIPKVSFPRNGIPRRGRGRGQYID
jgi:hypothetical protein